MKVTDLNPPTDDLQALHQWCNQRYWNGELPEDLPVEWNSRLSRVTGRMTSHPGGAVPYRIQLSESIRGDSRLMVNVLVHEQIHLWQHYQTNTTGNREYIDREKVRGFPHTNKGHGRYFHYHMNRLNRDFPELKIGVLDDAVIELDEAPSEILYGLKVDLHYKGRTESALFVGDQDLSGLGDRLVPQIQSVYGCKILEAITPFVTMNPTLKKMEKLTKSLNVKKNQKGALHHKKYVDVIMDDETTSLGESFPIQEFGLESSMPEDLVDSNIKLKKYRYRTLDDYLSLYVANTESLTEKGLHKHQSYYLLAGGIDGMESGTLDFIEEGWRDVRPSDLMKSMQIKSTMRHLIMALSKKNAQEDAQRYFDKAWLTAGPSRIGRKDFGKVVEKNIAQFFKKTTSRGAVHLVKELMEQLDTSDKILNFEDLMRLSPNNMDASEGEFRARMLALYRVAGIKPETGIELKIDRRWANPSNSEILGSASGRMAKVALEKMVVSDNAEFEGDFVSHYRKFATRVSPEDFVGMLADQLESPIISDYKESLVSLLKPHQKTPQKTKNEKREFDKASQLDMGF